MGNVSLKMFFSKCSVFSTAVNLCCSSPKKVSVRIVCFLHVQRWVLFSSKVLHGQGPSSGLVMQGKRMESWYAVYQCLPPPKSNIE